MSKKFVLVALLITIIALILVACGSTQAAGSATPTPSGTAVPSSNVISAEAVIVPKQYSDLAAEISGRIVEIPIAEGDKVEAGEALLRLDAADLKASLAQAEAGLASAQAQLADTRAGATPEQIAQGEAAVSKAEAALAKLVSSPTKEDLAIAEARLQTLQAQLAKALAGTRPEELETSAASVLQAEAKVRQAQSDYDRVAYAPDSVEALPAATALEEATLAYQAAKAQHQALISGATPEEIQILKDQVAEGQASLNQVKAGASAEDIAQAQASVKEAEAALAEIKAGSTKEKIAMAEAAGEQAQATLEQARVALAKTEIKSPFAGTIGSVNVREGEYVSSGSPLLSVAELGTWKVETDDLSEIDVVYITEGQKAKVTVDALPGEVFSGTVARIKPRSVTKAGDVTYTVTITLDEPGANNSRLRWGMTALVEIEKTKI